MEMLEFRLRLEFVPGVRINDIPAVGEIMASLTTSFIFSGKRSATSASISRSIDPIQEWNYHKLYSVPLKWALEAHKFFLDNCRGTKNKLSFHQNGWWPHLETHKIFFTAQSISHSFRNPSVHKAADKRDTNCHSMLRNGSLTAPVT